LPTIAERQKPQKNTRELVTLEESKEAQVSGNGESAADCVGEYTKVVVSADPQLFGVGGHYNVQHVAPKHERRHGDNVPSCEMSVDVAREQIWIVVWEGQGIFVYDGNLFAPYGLDRTVGQI
jgi:hypothetical protein